MAAFCGGDPYCIGAIYCYAGDLQCFVGWACNGDPTCNNIGLKCQNGDITCLNGICNDDTECINYAACG